MSKAKDKARAEKDGRFVDGQRGLPPAPKGKKWIKCLYPPCTDHVLVEEEIVSPLVGIKPKQVTLPFCQAHGEMCMFMLWLLPQVRVQPGMTPGGIVTPGNPAFNQPAPTIKPP